MGGLCKEHHEEKVLRQNNQDAARHLLETGTVGGRLLEKVELRDEWKQLRIRFERARSALVSGFGTEAMPLDEAEYAIDWCVSLAHQIRLAELAGREGRAPDGSLDDTRQWVWERFSHLESGRMSNGHPRS